MKKVIPFILLFALCSLTFKPAINVASSQSLAKKVIVLDPGHGRTTYTQTTING